MSMKTYRFCSGQPRRAEKFLWTGSGTPFNLLVFLLFFLYISYFFISVRRSVSFFRDHHAGDSQAGAFPNRLISRQSGMSYFFIKQESPIQGQEQYGTEVYS